MLRWCMRPVAAPAHSGPAVTSPAPENLACPVSLALPAASAGSLPLTTTEVSGHKAQQGPAWQRQGG